MTTETLLALAERAERASGPDRELDIAIGFAVLGWSWGEDGFGGEYLNFGAPNLVGWRQAIDPVPDCVPSPTASLDTAMLLAGNDPDFDLSREHDGKWLCLVGEFGGEFGEWTLKGSAKAAAPALALTAAALRARAAMETNDG